MRSGARSQSPTSMMKCLAVMPSWPARAVTNAVSSAAASRDRGHTAADHAPASGAARHQPQP